MVFTPTNRAKASEIVGRYPRPKSAILPLAHLAQDQDGWLTGDAMKEIAELVGVTPAEVLGTCSFYTMLKREPVGRLVVSVCTNVSCLVTGGPDVLAHLDARYADDDDVYVEEVECLAACGGAPALQVNYEFHENVTPESAEGVVEAYKAGELEPRTVSGTAATEGSSPASERPRAGQPVEGWPGPQRASETGMPETRLITKRLHDRPDDSWTIEAALATGAYDGLRTALTMTPAAIGQEQVKASGLRGRGGAGFPAATKWSFLPEGSHPRYLVVNDDEGEPSTFKDRMLTERDPHQLIEGIVIAAFAIEAHLAFIYIRGEFALGYERLEQAVTDAYAQGFLGKNILGSGFDLDVVIHRGAGAYICGEETALLESLEGERGMPRIRPPFPAIEGLYAKPTVVNNVETLSTLPHIIAMGGEKYAELGVGKSTGTRIFSLSGHVNRPGNYEVELGTTFRELIEAPDLGGGVPNGRTVKFLIPGGASSQWLTGEHLDVPLDMDVVQQEYGVMLGSGAVMVFDDTTNPALVAWRLAKFFAHESCGKCTPCREGTGWIEKVLYRISHGLGRPEDLDLLVDVGDGISPGVVNAPFTQTTICPLGPSAVSAVASLDKYFRDEVIAMCRVPVRTSVPVGAAPASPFQDGPAPSEGAL